MPAGGYQLRGNNEDLFVAGDKVAIRSKMRHTDPISCKPQRGTILDISRFVGDKIA